MAPVVDARVYDRSDGEGRDQAEPRSDGRAYERALSSRLRAMEATRAAASSRSAMASTSMAELAGSTRRALAEAAAARTLATEGLAAALDPTTARPKASGSDSSPTLGDGLEMPRATSSDASERAARRRSGARPHALEAELAARRSMLEAALQAREAGHGGAASGHADDGARSLAAARQTAAELRRALDAASGASLSARTGDPFSRPSLGPAAALASPAGGIDGPRPAGGRAAEPPRPRIEVRIGRIDVRTASAGAAPSPGAAKAARASAARRERPQVSLDAYLRRRRGS